MPLVMLKSDPRARLKPCLRCGYSLRHITDSRHCPECGLAIWITLSGNDELDMSSPPWLRRLAWGALAAALANAAPVAGLVMGWTFGRLSPRGVLAFGTITYAWQMAYLLAGGAGLLLMAGEEGRYPQRAGGARRSVLAAAIASLACAAWLTAFRLGYGIRPPHGLVMAVILAQGAATWPYVRALARRIPNQRIVRLAHGLFIATLLALATLLVRGGYWPLLVMVTPWRRLVIPWTLFQLIYPTIAAATLLFLARALCVASKTSEKSWAAESA